MIDKKLIEEENKDKNNIENLFKNIEILSEINDCEYIYIDKIDQTNITNPLLENKIIVTKKINNYFILDNNTNNPQMTKMDYKHIVDMLILNNNKTNNDIKELVDQDTIIIKNLGNNIIYIEDKRKELKIIITEYEKIVLTGNSINTQLKYYEILN